jgi:hypothetical protein
LAGGGSCRSAPGYIWHDESTGLGPFFVPNSPLREYGANIASQPAGDPTSDGPVGRMLDATGVTPRYRTLTTHIFDATSDYTGSDAVFAVKPSLLREFVRRSPEDPETPPGVDGDWYSVENDLVLAAAEADEPADDGRTA